MGIKRPWAAAHHGGYQCGLGKWQCGHRGPVGDASDFNELCDND